MFGFKNRDILIFCCVLFVVVFSYFYIDRGLALYFHNLTGSKVEDFISSLSFLGKSHWYLIPSILLFYIFKRSNRYRYAQMALYVFVTNVVAGLGVWLLKFPFGRLRPKMLFNHGEYGFEGFGIHYSYVSFPSGHSITIFSTATALALLFPRFSIPLFLSACVIAFSRVTVGAHYFSDVIMGSYLGILVAIVLYKKMILEKDFA